jgi:hypothetical protein
MSHKPLFQVVLQRTDWDCGVAALASLIGQPYEEVLRESAKWYAVERGLFSSEMVQIAKQFDITLKRRVKRIDLEEHCGVLSLRFPCHGATESHAVLLMSGLIFDPQEKGTVWEADTYITFYEAKMIDLLQEVEG